MSYHFTKKCNSRFKGGDPGEDGEPELGRAGLLGTMVCRSHRPTPGGCDAPISRASEVYCTRQQCPHIPGRPGVGTQGHPAVSRSLGRPRQEAGLGQVLPVGSQPELSLH